MKNRNIAKVFREVGFADELGSGVKNLYKYSKAYGGSDPVIIEGEVFKLEVQVPSETTQKTTKEQILKLLKINSKITREELAQTLNLSPDTIKQHLANLQKEGKLARVGGRKNGDWRVL